MSVVLGKFNGFLKVKLWRISLIFLMLFSIACSDEPLKLKPSSVTLVDYQRAQSLLASNTNKLVHNALLAQYWQLDDTLIYQQSTVGGSQFVLSNPLTGAERTLFQWSELAVLLADFAEDEFDPDTASIDELVLAGLSLDFNFEAGRYHLNLDDFTLEQLIETVATDEFLSPDGTQAAFIDNYNLWVRDTATDELSQLTFDGEADYGYATNNAGWLREDGPVLLWSPSSDKIATFKHDSRNVGEMYLVSTQVGHPELDAWKYPLPGDEFIFQIERVIIHLEQQPRLVVLQMPADAHRSSTSDHVADNDGTFLDVQWRDDGSELAFVSTSRDHKMAHLQIADSDSGQVRSVFEESVETYFESGSQSSNWRVLFESNEFIWFSERDNWGHLYLYDLSSGTLKHQITSGFWNVTVLYEVDEEGRQLYFRGSVDGAVDPYYQTLYVSDFDSKALVNLTPEPLNHVINWSQSGLYFSDVYSTPSIPPQAALRNQAGERVLDLGEADISALIAQGWVAPIAFSVKARDQLSDLYGLMYKPSNFDDTLKYPVLNYLYPGPQSGSVGSRSFRSARADKQALAELGFIVVEVDAMGTPGRSKSFHDAYYGDMGDNGLPDQVAMIRQLGARYAWMDLDNIGIWGHSGGGFASTAGLLRYPEFYKVAVSGAGNHDNRNYEDDWGEKWQGLLVEYPETNPEDVSSSQSNPDKPIAKTNYDSQANQLLVDNLQGKLLLAHGLMDDNVHPSNTFLVVDALIKADKDFDMFVLPSATHGFGNRRFFMQRRWDYFVQHLKHVSPPSDFVFSDNIR